MARGALQPEQILQGMVKSNVQHQEKTELTNNLQITGGHTGFIDVDSCNTAIVSSISHRNVVECKLRTISKFL